MSKFQDDIAKFNGIYKLPVALFPTLEAVGDPVQRLIAFKKILLEEIEEIEDVLREVAEAASLSDNRDAPHPDFEEAEIIALTSLADLLGDIQVYAASEMAKFGLPLDWILAIIMESNFSKLGSDGNPIYDERGKVMKGPNYWKPEPQIKELLLSLKKK